MSRWTAVSFVVAVAGATACSPKVPGEDVCTQVPTPAGCNQSCNPAPGAPDTCPSGLHCTPDGVCDAQCTATGGQCGPGYTCTSDGQCSNLPSPDAAPVVDAACPAVHYTPAKVTPSIELVLDRSGSMDMSDISPTRYQALHTGLTGTGGAVTTTQSEVYFGAALFAADQTPCLTLTGYTAPRALNNATVIDTLITNHPPNGGNTPTANAITMVTADFTANPPPAGSPPIILLATDGEPNSCTGADGTQSSIQAVQAAYTAGIKTFIVGLANLNTGYLQEIANAGTGLDPNTTSCTPATCSPYYAANDPASLVAALNNIVDSTLSCDLTITGQIDPSQASTGTVTLNGVVLTYGTDWTLDPNGMIIHLIGAACTELKDTPNAVVDASFPCGSVIE